MLCCTFLNLFYNTYYLKLPQSLQQLQYRDGCTVLYSPSSYAQLAYQSSEAPHSPLLSPNSKSQVMDTERINLSTSQSIVPRLFWIGWKYKVRMTRSHLLFFVVSLTVKNQWGLLKEDYDKDQSIKYVQSQTILIINEYDSDPLRLHHHL